MKNLNCSGIYKIINTLNGKYYIGSSQNVKTRIRKHFELLKRNVHHCLHLQNSYNLRGGDVFDVFLLEVCDVGKLIEVEQKYLDDIIDWKTVYNVNKMATGSGYDLSAHPNESEIRKRMSNGNIGKHTKPYIVDGVRYETLQEGANKLGVNFSTIGYRLRNWKNKNYYYIDYPKKGEYCVKTHGKLYKFTKPLEKKKYYCLCGCEREISKYAKYHDFCRKFNQKPTHNNRCVVVDNVEYLSPKEASRILKIEYATLIYRINTNTITHKDYYYKDSPKDISKLITINDINKKISEKNMGNKGSNHKPFTIDGIYYLSLSSAVKKLSIPKTTIVRRLKSEKFTTYTYLN